MSVTELAQARGISKPAVTQALQRWAEAGVVVSTRKAGKKLLVNVAEYDRARGEAGDLSKQQGEATKKGISSDNDPIFAYEQARKAAYDADLAMIKRDEQLKRLIPVEDMERAAVTCGEAAVRRADGLVNRAEDLAAAVAKNGVTGARTVLKDIARDLRQGLADDFSQLGALAVSPDLAPETPES